MVFLVRFVCILAWEVNYTLFERGHSSIHFWLALVIVYMVRHTAAPHAPPQPRLRLQAYQS